MVEKIIKLIIAFIGLSIGVVFGIYLTDFVYPNDLLPLNRMFYVVMMPVLFGIIFAFLTYIASKLMIAIGKKLAQLAQNELEKIPQQDLAVSFVGLVLGMLIAFLISGLFDIIPLPVIANALKILSYIFFAYLGINIAQRIAKDNAKIGEISRRVSPTKPQKDKGNIHRSKPKILDTSVIIDGRIADICKAGFVEGEIVIPEFVLRELQHIADSADALKRNRGRRGLDILQIIQQDLATAVRIVDEDFEDVPEVDVKLIKLAQRHDAAIVTNDYNLNKVASLQDVSILNINELANAVKPVVIPGEEMLIQVIKEGKESNQGVSYLDDGTMIVVEDGKKYINETIQVLVTSVLQTAAGRMIFVKPKG